MIIPPNTLTQVYKIVQVDEAGRLWSVNAHLTDGNKEVLVEYLFNHQIFPNNKVKALFAFLDYKTVMAYVSVYNTARRVEVLRCLAHRVRAVDNHTLPTDFAIAESINNGHYGQYDFSFPTSSRTGSQANIALCDWLIPLNFVKIPKKFLTPY